MKDGKDGKDDKLGNLRALVREIVAEDAGEFFKMPSLTGSKPPPLPAAAKKPAAAPASAALPQKGALTKFKADVNMAADAATKCKAILDAGQGDTKEALRWLDKVIAFATSAKGVLGVK